MPSVLEPGVPDITGAFTIRRAGFSYSSGAFYEYSNGNSGWGSGSNDTQTTGEIKFSAKESNPLYGNSDTVQPAAIVLLPQIKY